MAGRPITWTQDKKKDAIKLIFEGIYKGNSVRSIIDNADRNILPSWVTFNEWLKADDELIKQYVHVCEARFDLIFDDIINIADNVEHDIITLPDGREVENKGVINRDRLRVDARKWALSKMNPKKYGDKLEVEQKQKAVIEFVNVSKQFPDKK